jgi:hypothetical protein
MTCIFGPGYRALDAWIIGRSRLRFDLGAHLLEPLLGAEVELVGELVPEAILASDLRKHELTIKRLRRRSVVTEEAMHRHHVEPLRRFLQSSRCAVARPAMLFGPPAHLRAYRVEDDVAQDLGEIRFPSIEEMAAPAMRLLNQLAETL